MSDDKDKKEDQPKTPAVKDGDAADGAAAAPAEEASTGLSRKKKILLFLVLPLILLIAAGGATYYIQQKNKKPPDCAEIKEGEEGFAACAEQKAKAEGKPVSFIDVPDIIVNLNSPAKQPRYLKITLKIELDTDLDRQMMEKLMPRVVDQFQMYLRELRIDDLRGTSGIYRLKIELLSRVRASAPNVKVHDVLFQEILVQ